MRNLIFTALTTLALTACHHDDDKDHDTGACLQDTAADTAVDTGTDTADTSVTVGCSDETGAHASGESWTCPDGCNTCSCDNGSIVSTEMACADTGDTSAPADTSSGSDTGTSSDTGAPADTSSGR